MIKCIPYKYTATGTTTAVIVMSSSQIGQSVTVSDVIRPTLTSSDRPQTMDTSAETIATASNTPTVASGTCTYFRSRSITI